MTTKPIKLVIATMAVAISVLGLSQAPASAASAHARHSHTSLRDTAGGAGWCC